MKKAFPGGGNDVNGYAAKMLRDMGFDVECAFTQDVSPDGKQYDIVTCLDYLEHSYTPFADLKFMLQILKPGGVLHLKTLYLGSPKHEAEGEAWDLFGMGHFHFFWPDVLETMVRNAGFEVLSAPVANLIKVIARRPESVKAAARIRPRKSS